MHSPFRLLVAGGSMGAHRLNEVLVETLGRLKRAGVEIHATHLTGVQDESAVRDGYRAAGVEADVIAFTKYLAPLYHAADLAICRAGASTCAELAFFGVPALFVPYPLAAMDHQTANARALEKRGAADVVEESALTPGWLEAYLAQTVERPERLERMREAARREASATARRPWPRWWNPAPGSHDGRRTAAAGATTCGAGSAPGVRACT